LEYLIIFVVLLGILIFVLPRTGYFT